MNQQHDIPIEASLQMVKDIASGLEHLHRYDIVHFDIKPLNILVDQVSDDEIQCVISDLGSCKVVGTDLTSVNERVIKGLAQPEKAHVTISYASPEFIRLFGVKKKNCLPIHKMIDIYAFGLTIFEILNREKAWSYESVKDFRDFVLSGGRPTISQKLRMQANKEPIAKFILELSQTCWNQDPVKRPSIGIIQDLLSKI
jgi:serine/threonine protein kinase